MESVLSRRLIGLFLIIAVQALLAVAAAEDDGVECRFKSGDARWRKACNWCRCSETQKGICTRRGCPPGLAIRLQGEKQCEGDAEWKEECNWCNCVDGEAVCSTTICTSGRQLEMETPESSVRATLRQAPSDATCVQGSEEASWKEDCNTCSCSQNGHSVCTRMACLPGIEKSSGSVEPECSGEVRWRSSCNWCECIEGVAVCSTDTCAKDAVQRVERESDCQTSDQGRWRVDCNWCRCGNGFGLCTKRGCIKDATESTDTPACEGDVTWKKDDCNWCRCKDGVSLCTQNTCAAKAPTETAPSSCTDGQTWAEDCNNCRCFEGTPYCTQVVCPEGSKIEARQFREHSSNLNELLNSPSFEDFTCKKGSRWTMDCNSCSCSNELALCTFNTSCVPGESSPSDEATCEDGSLWKMDCNICSCMNGFPVCTEKACSRARQGDTEDPDVECKVKSKDARWRNSCNWCRCSDTGKGVCTRRGCPSGFTTRLQNQKQCEGDIEWKQECNWCNCVEERANCTTNECEPSKPSGGVSVFRSGGSTPTDGARTEAVCTEGSRWKRYCNWCSCSGGVATCEENPCPSMSVATDHGTCEGDSRWTEDCNWCDCVEGKGICTSAFCPGEGPSVLRAGVAAASETSPAAEGEEQEAECAEGSRWGQGCNWCTCQKGKGVCTLRGCLPGFEKVNDGACEGSSRWKQDCNWCNCVDGKGVCTLKACLKPSSRGRTATASCITGNSWTKDCNVCLCTNGVETCTKRVCAPSAALKQSSTCAEGETWKDECNRCICHDGKGACTRMLCLPGSRSEKVLAPPELCTLPPIEPNAEVCGGFEIKWTFSTILGKCDEVVYGGCGGTKNLFDSLQDCQTACGSKTLRVGEAHQTPSERCFLAVEQGPCFGLLRRFAFVPERNRCEVFFYGGCQGNQNNFETSDECFNVCGGSPPAIDTSCDRTKCDWKRLAHYIAKQCQPVYEGGACCPTSFACEPEKDPQQLVNQCFYKGRKYAIGDRVSVDDECSAACRCTESHEANKPAEITCADVECPSLFRKPEPGCRNLYEQGKCCSVKEECTSPDTPPEVEPRTIQCEWKNDTWRIGDRMYFDDEPCQKCVCTPEFTDPKGPGCERINCGYDFRTRYKERLSRGCTPVFFEQKCCSIGWMCPEEANTLRNIIEPKKGTSPAFRSAECSLGDVVVPLGGSVGLDDCHVKCSCQTPPDLTCVRYRSCEIAEESLLTPDGENCPKIDCPSGCNKGTDRVTGCPKCFCNNMNFVCPEPSCPPACENPSIEFDESKGCSVCKCTCRTNHLGKPNCPMDCAVKIVFNAETGCDKCVCDTSVVSKPVA